MQNPKSLFNEAFYLMNSDTIKSIEEDYYTLIHTNKYFNKNRRFTFIANTEDYKSAIGLFEQFIKLNPNCKFAYNYCAIARKCLKDYIGAISDFAKAIAIDPSYEFAHFNRGHTQFVLENYIEAIKDISVAIALNKKMAKYYEIRGNSQKNLKDFKGAIKDFTKCIRLQPDNYSVFRLRAFAYLELNNLEKAIEDFNTVYNNDYKNFGAFFSRGNAYLKLKKYNLAVEDLSKAAKKDSDNGSINSLLKEAKTKLYIEEQSLLQAKMPSKKPFILKAIATMDVSLLEVLLEDYKTYQDAPKDIFIEKLKVAFDEFKAKNDTELLPHKGKCNGTGCENKGCSGFSFVGNISKMHLDLIFEETDNNYKDICKCSEFKTDVKIKKLNGKVYLDIEEDEKAYFVKTADYLSKVDAATKAFSEIITTPQRLLDFEQLSFWIKKQSDLYKRIDGYDFFGPTMKWTAFAQLYYDLMKIEDYLNKNLPEIHNAYNQYQQLDTEQNRIDWILKYETIFENAPYGFQKSSITESVIEYSLDKKTSVLFYGQEFLETFRFIANFKTDNNKLLQKYCIYNVEEFHLKYNDSRNKNIQKEIFRLKYHIRKREALAKIGIEVPLFQISHYF